MLAPTVPLLGRTAGVDTKVRHCFLDSSPSFSQMSLVFPTGMILPHKAEVQTVSTFPYLCHLPQGGTLVHVTGDNPRLESCP